MTSLAADLSGWTPAMVAQSWIDQRIGAWLALLILAAGVSAWTGRVVHARLNSVLSIFSTSTAIALLAVWVRGTRLSPLQQLAESSALLALVWTFVAWARSPKIDANDADRTNAALLRLTSVLFAAAATIPLILMLVMRGVLVGVDLLHGYPSPPLPSFGFEAVGLVSFAMLLTANLIGWRLTRDVRLASTAYWLLAAGAVWAVLLIPAFRFNSAGGFERSSMSLAMLASWALLIAAAGIATRNPAVRMSCAALAIPVMLLGCYHLLVPVVAPWAGVHGARAVTAASLGLCAAACLWMVRFDWSDGLSDAGMGCVSLAWCAGLLAVIPFDVVPLSENYPRIFNAIIVALAVATGGWTLLGCGRIEAPWSMSADARDGLASHARRFAFLCSALALVAAALMTYWPRIPAIAAMDHSFGRVMAGFGAHLFLLLVMLWSSRWLKRVTFHMLTLLAVISTIGFLVVRVIPFASKAG